MASPSFLFLVVLVAFVCTITDANGGRTRLTSDEINSAEFKERTLKTVAEVNKKKANSLPECVEYEGNLVSGTKQVVAGMKYILNVHLTPAKSNKDECAAANIHLGEELHQDCEIEIWEKSWINFQKITVKC